MTIPDEGLSIPEEIAAITCHGVGGSRYPTEMALGLNHAEPNFFAGPTH
jgi:hypothetical protein